MLYRSTTEISPSEVMTLRHYTNLFIINTNRRWYLGVTKYCNNSCGHVVWGVDQSPSYHFPCCILPSAFHNSAFTHNLRARVRVTYRVELAVRAHIIRIPAGCVISSHPYIRVQAGAEAVWCDLVEMFNCIVDTVEDSSSVRSYRKFLIANFCYKYIHKTIKLTEHYNT